MNNETIEISYYASFRKIKDSIYIRFPGLEISFDIKDIGGGVYIENIRASTALKIYLHKKRLKELPVQPSICEYQYLSNEEVRKISVKMIQHNDILLMDGRLNAIGETIFKYIAIENGLFHRYLPIEILMDLVDSIKKTGITTEYLRFVPFYKNCKTGEYIEFDEYAFYIECRENITQEEIEKFRDECWAEEWNSAWGIKRRVEVIRDRKKRQFHLCRSGDVEDFNKALDIYIDYALTFFYEIGKELVEFYNIKEQDFLYGYFSFEITNG